MQRLPVRNRLFQRFALRRARLVLHIGKGRFVRCDQTSARTAFNRHVADRHAAFHRQRANSATGIFDHITGAARSADFADDGKRDVLGGDAGSQFALNTHEHVLGFLLDQRLGSQNVFYLGGADTMRQRTESAMRGGVAVAADNGHARQGEALLRPDDVHDTLTAITLGIIFNVEIRSILGQSFDLNAAFLVLDTVDAVR